MNVRRYDKVGRDITDLPGLWSESDVVRDSRGRPFSKWNPAQKFEYTFGNSEWSDLFARCEREVAFTEARKWRFDYAWTVIRLAVEIDGGSSDGFGRHQQMAGQAEDNDKLNQAVFEGWRVLRFNSRNLGSKANVEAAVELVAECICQWD